MYSISCCVWKTNDMYNLRVFGCQFFFILTKTNIVNYCKSQLREYLLGMPLIVLHGLFTTQILGVLLEQTVLYSMSSGNLTNKASQTNAIVMRLR